MVITNLDREWEFRRGFCDSLGGLKGDFGKVNLPHDGMISTVCNENAPAKHDSGYFMGDVCNYTKYVCIPAEWDGESVGLKFDGIMMHATIDVNGAKVYEHHYGYSPFYVDITDYVSYGEENRITININTGVQPSSRWYTGSGLFRGVSLCHSPKVHVADNGIYVRTKEVSDNVAFLEAEIDVCNDSDKNRLAKATLTLVRDCKAAAVIERVIQINAHSTETAHMAFVVNDPLVWDIDTPNLYDVKVTVADLGVYSTRLIKNDNVTVDEASTLFGIRTITVDAIRGLRINGKTVKLKGGCVHHDNGLLGAVSLYEAEARKVKKLKEVGFNAIRTAHNPPSSALVEACDRLGMYIFDEAFDAWSIAKRPGDFNTYFEKCWEEELTAFVKRDRIHPSVIMWSTGNEIPERGGLRNGYSVATRLAITIKKLDPSRPVSNGICSLWSGLDDYLAKGQNLSQNAETNEELLSWDRITEPFTNGLDVVGYNYMEDLYENSHKLFPDRVILGSENFPKEIGFRWPYIEKLPYVIGDFTWTAWDYIGEAGIGKSKFVDSDDPLASQGPWALMPDSTSPYPWRLANDADYDITGRMRPQGAYRSVVWGSSKTHLYTYNPAHFGKVEVIGMWGFTDVNKCWNYKGCENKKTEVIVFSNAEEVELLVNGVSVDKKPVGMERPLPYSVRFETVYTPGKIEAVSYKDGKEVSRDEIVTSGEPSKLIVCSEKDALMADGHDVTYVNIDVVDSNGVLVSDASIDISAVVEGAAVMSGFGTGNPYTKDLYTDCETTTFNGHATIAVRSGYDKGKTLVRVTAREYDLSTECCIEAI